MGGTAAVPGTAGLGIDAAGNVGISVVTPTARRHLAGREKIEQTGGTNALDVTTTGTGVGVFSTSAGNHGVWGITQTISGAGVIGDNDTGEAVVGRSQGIVGAAP